MACFWETWLILVIGCALGKSCNARAFKFACDKLMSGHDPCNVWKYVVPGADPEDIRMYMEVEKKFKKRPNEFVVKCLRSTSQVESFNAELAGIWGSGTNMGTLLTDFEALDRIIFWDLRTLAGIRGLPFIMSSNIGRLAAIRALRRQLKLPDKYKLVPYMEDMRSLALATPFGFEAMRLSMDPSGQDIILQGVTHFTEPVELSA